MTSPELEGLVHRRTNNLWLFVLGPGVGECQVVLLPDGRVLVVDACMKGDRNLGIELLQLLGVEKVDLFVVTHPDKDHVRGADGLLHTFPPDKLWTYPMYASLRTALVKAKRLAEAHGVTPSPILSDLSVFSDAVERFPRARTEQVRGRRSPWTFAECGYEVYPIAPSSPDEEFEGDRLMKALLFEESDTFRARRFVSFVERFLSDGDRPGDHPNALSIALSIVAADRRLLLAGDVERCDETPSRGWSGVIQELQDPSAGRLHLIQSLAAVKVAHHGSKGAVHSGAWREHAASGANPMGIIAPYANTPLPREDGLQALAAYCTKLAVTETSARVRTDAAAAGWKEDISISKGTEDFPMVGLEIPPHGDMTLSVWKNATVWTQPVQGANQCP